jgi:hypothetical protein
MKALFLWVLLLVLLIGVSEAVEVKILVIEEKTKATTYYTYDVETSGVKPVASVSGGVVAQVRTFSIKDRRLLAGDRKVTNADQLLFQCRINGVDLVIVRDEYNSFSNPLRILSAFSGHPIQVSKIVILKIENGELKRKATIIQKPSSYEWTATILQ